MKSLNAALKSNFKSHVLMCEQSERERQCTEFVFFVLQVSQNSPKKLCHKLQRNGRFEGTNYERTVTARVQNERENSK